MRRSIFIILLENPRANIIMEFSFRHELSISELRRLSISELPGERILKLKFPNKKKVMNII